MIRVRVPVLIADGSTDANGVSHTRECTKLPDGPVRVTRNYGTDYADLLGKAELSWDGDTVMADLTLGDSFAGLVDLAVPAVGGKITRRGPGTLVECTIEEVTLTSNPNADSRIGQIKEIKK